MLPWAADEVNEAGRAIVIHGVVKHWSGHSDREQAEATPSRRKVPELNDEHVRELSLYSYRLIYEIRKRDIFVLAVVHKRRDLKAGDIQITP